MHERRNQSQPLRDTRYPTSRQATIFVIHEETEHSTIGIGGFHIHIKYLDVATINHLQALENSS